MTAADTEEFPGQLEMLDPSEQPLIPGQRVDDPAAPYGFTQAGTVRNKPGRKPAAKKAAPKAIAAPAKKAAPRQAPTPPGKKQMVDYGPALTALAGQFIGPVAVVGLVKGDVRLIADAATVTSTLPAIVEGANMAADQWPVVAAILDKVCKVGPYANAIGGLTLMLGQIAVNHGVIPAGVIPGTLPPDKLAEKFIREQAAADEQFAAVVEHLMEARANAGKAASA